MNKQAAIRQQMKEQRQQMRDFYDSVGNEVEVITNLVNLTSKVTDGHLSEILTGMVQKRVEILEMTLNPESYAKRVEAEVTSSSEEPVAV
jgi:Fe-S cluster assembly ATPase SufC